MTHLLLYFIALITLSVRSQTTIETPMYGSSGTATATFFNQGKTHQIEWEIAMKLFKWNGIRCLSSDSRNGLVYIVHQTMTVR